MHFGLGSGLSLGRRPDTFKAGDYAITRVLGLGLGFRVSTQYEDHMGKMAVILQASTICHGFGVPS